MSKLMIWDIDGTLLHCFGSGRQAMEESFLSLYGVEKALDGVMLAGAVDLAVVLQVQATHSLEDFVPEAFFSYYAGQLVKQIKTGKGIEVLGGITEVLSHLQQPGVYHVVGTGNCQPGARVKLGLSGLEHFFETGAFGDEVLTRGELLALAKRKAEDVFKVKFFNEDVMVVGDTPADILAAKANDFIAVATTTGYYGERALAQHEPDYVIDHFSELLGIIDNQWPKDFWV